MQQIFIEGGLIRKLWSVETDAYRDHLLRLDPESRRNHFSAAIAHDTIRSYAETTRGSDVILHGFFVNGVLRGIADLRSSDARRRASASRSRGKAGRRLGGARTHPARRAQPGHQASALNPLQRQRDAISIVCFRLRRRERGHFGAFGEPDQPLGPGGVLSLPSSRSTAWLTHRYRHRPTAMPPSFSIGSSCPLEPSDALQCAPLQERS